MYLTKGEFQTYSKLVKDQLNTLNLTVLGYNPNYPITLADLGSDITTFYNPAQYYKRGEAIEIRDLPPNIATTTYVTTRTRGAISLVPAYDAIDEVVAAREGQINLVTNLGLYSTKAALITNINALSGTINAARIATIAHSSLSGLTSSGCHSQGAITDLTTDLGNKANKATIISEVNASTEESAPGVRLKITNDRVQAPAHNDCSSRTVSDAHDIASITGLSAALSDGSDAKAAITAAIPVGYTSLKDYLDCMRAIVDHYNDTLPAGTFSCWVNIV